MPSPGYTTTNVLLPAVKLSTGITATPSSIVPGYSLPSITTVTSPVAFTGTPTVITACSPSVISVTLTSIGVSYIGTVAVALTVTFS